MIRFRPTLDYTHINRVLSNHPFIVYFLTVSKQAENVRMTTVDNRHHCSRLIFHLDNILRMESCLYSLESRKMFADNHKKKRLSG